MIKISVQASQRLPSYIQIDLKPKEASPDEATLREMPRFHR
jgi:hypothetical protein